MYDASSHPEQRKSNFWRILLYFFAAALILSCFACAGGLLWFFSLPESGVKLGNEMDGYALDYITEHNLIDSDESILAYYDATMVMDSSEAAILTDKRLIYHIQGNTTSMLLKDIVDIQHTEESYLGDIIVAIGNSGQSMKIEIPPLNGGATFYQILLNAWHNATD